MVNYLLLIVFLIYIFIYKKFWNKKIFESIVFGFIIFFGVNSVYFFIVSIFNLELSIFSLFLLNFVYSILFYCVGKNIRIKNPLKSKSNSYEIVIITAAIFCIVLFIFNFKSFNNGFRVPIPSFTEDAAAHFNYALNFLSNNKLSGGFYPHAFHGNAWLSIKLVTRLIGVNNDIVLITNIFSMYIWLIFFLTISLMSIIVFDLVNNNEKSNFYWKIIIPIVTVVFGSVISLYFVKHGFLSNWFNQLFSLGMIYLLSRNESKSIFLLIPLSFGFFFSYSFFAPVLCIFYGYLWFFKKEKEYLSLLIITLLLSIIFMLQIFSSVFSLSGIVAASGGFPVYPVMTLLIYVILSIYFLSKNNKKESKTSKYLSIIALVFLFYSFGLAILQLYIKGEISYSFHKVFASSILFFSMFAVAGFIVFLKSIFKKNNKTSTSIFNKIMIFIFIILISFKYASIINPPLGDIIHGYGNFFSNSSEKYNGVIYALENFSNFKNVIYIDGDYQSTRWATSSYLLTKYNVIYDLKSVINYKNYDYYISQLKQIDSNTLIVNPIKVLEFDCESEGLIKIATQSANIYIYPPFDLDLFRRNCSVSLNKNKNE